MLITDWSLDVMMISDWELGTLVAVNMGKKSMSLREALHTGCESMKHPLYVFCYR